MKAASHHIRPIRVPRAALHRRPGYTLLEVVLALALSVLLIGGIAMAINYHLITLQEQQREIERSQIARQSLFLLAKDIRAAIQYKPIESSALDELIQGVSSSMDIGGLAEQAGIGTDMLEESGLAPAEQSDAAPSEYAATRPGLVGTSTQLQIDISRLPRKDQYNIVSFSDGTQSDIPSDVKTITYFVRNEENAENTSSEQVEISQSMGLVRRSLDRAVARYAEDYGGQINLEDYEEVLAVEITQIEFRYWDQENQQWETEWDSEQMMGLPSAVEITIALGTQSEANDDNAVDDRKIYRSVVFMPLAEIIPPELETEETEDSGSVGSAAPSGSSAGMGTDPAGGTDR